MLQKCPYAGRLSGPPHLKKSGILWNTERFSLGVCWACVDVVVVCVCFQECTNDCCNANNCTLKEEAQCAHGVCCEGCKVRNTHTHTWCRQSGVGGSSPRFASYLCIISSLSVTMSVFWHNVLSTCVSSHHSGARRLHITPTHLGSHLTVEMHIMTSHCNVCWALTWQTRQKTEDGNNLSAFCRRGAILTYTLHAIYGSFWYSYATQRYTFHICSIFLNTFL